MSLKTMILWLSFMFWPGVLADARPRLLAQESSPPAGNEAAPKGVVTTVQTSGYWLEYGLVIVVFGVALYSICRSSRRN